MQSLSISKELVAQCFEIAKANDDRISLTLVEDLLKEMKPNATLDDLDSIISLLKSESVEIEPSEPDESYAVGESQNSDGRFVPAEVSIRPRGMSMDQIIARLNYDEIDLHPNFQRKAGLWSDEQQSQLIESLMLKIPLPAFYFDATNDDRWVVIDGLQRLTVFERFFVKKELRLVGLEYLTEFNKKTYEELPRLYQRRIMESAITVYTVEKGTPEEIVYNIFKRINTGGINLAPQEIRHALYQGRATKLIEKLASSREFKVATDGAISEQRMLNYEYANRYLAFTQLDYEVDYQENIDQFLIKALKTVNNYTALQIKQTETDFYDVMGICHDIFGKYTFRRITPSGRRGRINKAIFELWSVCLYNLTRPQRDVLLQRKQIVFERFKKKLEDPVFSGWIGNGDKSSMINRIDQIKTMIGEIL